MGIKINDDIFLDIGITRSNTYSSFGNTTVRSVPTGTTPAYSLTGHADLWINKNKRTDGAPSVQRKKVSVGITVGQLDENIYGILYTELKTNYTSTTDD